MLTGTPQDPNAFTAFQRKRNVMQHIWKLRRVLDSKVLDTEKIVFV
jgi:hypothetical protein